MRLYLFSIQINRQPPFMGRFASAFAAWDAFWPRVFAEAAALGGCKLTVRALREAASLPLMRSQEQHRMSTMIEDHKTEAALAAPGYARPPEGALIAALAQHFQADARTLLGWLREIQLDAAEARLAALTL